MNRQPILSLLRDYQPSDSMEKAMQREAIAFIEAHADCFDRSQLKGHVTGSPWIVNPARTHALLIHHVKMDKWFQPGGHCDGDGDVQRVALKETLEETGFDAKPLGTGLFDVDNHRIPERGAEPAHIHYDMRFLMEAPMEAEVLAGNEEVRSIRWIPLDEIHRYNDSESILRMVRKT